MRGLGRRGKESGAEGVELRGGMRLVVSGRGGVVRVGKGIE